MDGNAELRVMWEFAATWKLLELLSRPLSFSAPTPQQLEAALVAPRDHLTVIANLHGRLVGLSAGDSSAKKWMQSARRFIRHRLDDFAFLAEAAPSVIKADPKNAMAQDEATAGEVQDGGLLLADAAFSGTELFPVEEQDYFRLCPSTRLLVLHTIAEIVLSEHDSLLSSGSLAEIDLREMRYYPIGSDAVGNNYWYFDDFERIYREPGLHSLETRKQTGDGHLNTAKEAAKEATRIAGRRAREVKRQDAEQRQGEVKRCRQERKRISMEKWAPRVAASRTTRASRRAEKSLLAERKQVRSSRNWRHSPANDPLEATSDLRMAEAVETVDGAKQVGYSEDEKKLQSESTEAAGRRRSGRRRKCPQDTEIVVQLSRTPKRPRKSDAFPDPSLRTCRGWEVLCTGGVDLKQVIDRFRRNVKTVLPSEKALVRRLEENVLPGILENEEKARKLLERDERKKRKTLFLSFTKRSSRVQALAQKREEEAKKMAEEAERERERLQVAAERDEVVKSQVALLEKEQSREIRIVRRAHGRMDVIERDDRLHRVMGIKAGKQAAQAWDGVVRRSSRTRRARNRPTEIDAENPLAFDDIKGSLPLNVDSQPLNSASVPKDVKEESGASLRQSQSEERVATKQDYKSHEGLEIETAEKQEQHLSRSGESQREVGGDGTKMNAAALRGSFLSEPASAIHEMGTSGKISAGTSEESVNDDYTWVRNPDDGEPIRVLDKFFFALQRDFADASLEDCETEGSHLVGFGILIPPSTCRARPLRVEICRVTDWVIEYGEQPKLWVKSEYAWYELRTPALEYRNAFVSSRRKYELCIRIAILGEVMRTAQFTYQAIVSLLSLRYEDMLAYTEEDMLKEKRFILSQMMSLNQKTVMRSGFMKELKQKIKTEDTIAAAVIHKLVARSRKTEPSAEDDARVKAFETRNRITEEETVQTAIVVKKQNRRRSSTDGKPVVPRVVSSIISSVLRTAMKSQDSTRKRKRNQGPAQHLMLDKITTSCDSVESDVGVNGSVAVIAARSCPNIATLAEHRVAHQVSGKGVMAVKESVDQNENLTFPAQPNGFVSCLTLALPSEFKTNGISADKEKSSLSDRADWNLPPTKPPVSAVAIESLCEKQQ